MDCVICQVDGYVARFDSDVVIGDSGVMPNTLSRVPRGQLSASATSLTSQAILSSTPASTFQHIMTNTKQNAGKGCCISVDNTSVVNRIYNCHRHSLF